MLRVECTVHSAYDATTVAVIAVATQIDVETTVDEGMPDSERKIKTLSISTSVIPSWASQCGFRICVIYLVQWA